MSKKNVIQVVGIASSGKVIIGDLFKMNDTHGLPLDMAIVESQKIGVTPSIPSYVCDAVIAGWGWKKAVDSAIQGVRDSDTFLGVIVPDEEYEEMRRGLTIAAKQPTRWCTKTLADKYNAQTT